jgi:hypothetical protein
MRTYTIKTKISETRAHNARLLWHHLGNKVAMMEARGYTTQQCDKYVARVLLQLESGRLEEGLLDSLGSFLTTIGDSTLSQGLKSIVGEKIVGMMGLQPGSFLGRVISNFIENTTATDLINLFGGSNKCKTVATRLAGAIQESLFEEFITEPNGLEPSSLLGKTIVEALKAQFVEGGPVVKAISDTVCKINLSSLLPGIGSAKSAGDIGSTLTDLVQGAGKAVENFGTTMGAAAKSAI